MKIPKKSFQEILYLDLEVGTKLAYRYVMIEKSFLLYLNEIKKFNLLSAEQEVGLSKKVASGDIVAINELITGNLRLVISIVKKLHVDSFSFEDAVQEGNLALITAAKKFDPSFGVRFGSYAYAWIVQSVIRFLYKRSSIAHVSFRKAVLAHRLKKAKELFVFINSKEPSFEDLAEFSGFSIEDVRENWSCLSGVCEIPDDYETSSPNPEEEFVALAEKQQVWSLMNLLPERERYIVYHHFNFEGNDKPKSLREIAKVLGTSAENVRRLEAKALERMRFFASNLESDILLFTA